MKFEKSQRAAARTSRTDLRQLEQYRTLLQDCDLDEGGLYVFTDGHDYEFNGSKGLSYSSLDNLYLSAARKLGLYGHSSAFALVATQRTIPG